MYRFQKASLDMGFNSLCNLLDSEFKQRCQKIHSQLTNILELYQLTYKHFYNKLDKEQARSVKISDLLNQQPDQSLKEEFLFSAQQKENLGALIQQLNFEIKPDDPVTRIFLNDRLEESADLWNHTKALIQE